MRHALHALERALAKASGALPLVSLPAQLPREGAAKELAPFHLEDSHKTLDFLRIFEGLRWWLLAHAKELAQLLLALVASAFFDPGFVLEHLAHAVTHLDVERVPHFSAKSAADRYARTAVVLRTRVLGVVTAVKDGTP